MNPCFPGGSAGKESTCSVESLGWEDPLEKPTATHSSILACRIPRTVHGVAKSQTQLSHFHEVFYVIYDIKFSII